MITKFCSRFKKSFNDKDDDDDHHHHISHIIVIFWLVPSSWISFTPPYLSSLYVSLPVCCIHTRTLECILSFIFSK
jgi:hypothetical protein